MIAREPPTGIAFRVGRDTARALAEIRRARYDQFGNEVKPMVDAEGGTGGDLDARRGSLAGPEVLDPSDHETHEGYVGWVSGSSRSCTAAAASHVLRARSPGLRRPGRRACLRHPHT
jgi:hypothetical protein